MACRARRCADKPVARALGRIHRRRIARPPEAGRGEKRGAGASQNLGGVLGEVVPDHHQWIGRSPAGVSGFSIRPIQPVGRTEGFDQKILALTRRKIGQHGDRFVAAAPVEGQGRRIEGIREGGPAAGLPGVGFRPLQQAASVASTAQGGRQPQPLDVQPAPPQPAQQAPLDVPAVVAEEAREHVQMRIARSAWVVRKPSSMIRWSSTAGSCSRTMCGIAILRLRSLYEANPIVALLDAVERGRSPSAAAAPPPSDQPSSGRSSGKSVSPKSMPACESKVVTCPRW